MAIKECGNCNWFCERDNRAEETEFVCRRYPQEWFKDKHDCCGEHLRKDEGVKLQEEELLVEDPGLDNIDLPEQFEPKDRK